jgi:glycosyltransferase involved in cell wall biosynthesis
MHKQQVEGQGGDNPAVRIAYTLEQCWHRVPGGSAVAAVEVARAMSEGTEVELVGVAARHRAPARPPFQPPVRLEQLFLPRPPLYEAWHYLRRPAVQSATGPVDVIHATTLAIPPRTAPLVVTIHDLAFWHYPDYFTRRGVRFFQRGLKLALRDADLVLCPSETTRADCVRAGFEEDRLEVVPFGVGVKPSTSTEVERVRGRYGLDDRYILFTGTIEPRKNLRGLLRAFSDLEPDTSLVLVGPKGWNEDLSSLVGEPPSRVKVLGFVPSADLGPLYAGATVVCLPSFLEGFGFPVLEAMAHGTPVVTSRGTSTEELAGDAAVLVDPHKAESIADGLRSVIEDAEFAEELRRRGQERAAEYSWSRTAELTARAYARVRS